MWIVSCFLKTFFQMITAISSIMAFPPTATTTIMHENPEIQEIIVNSNNHEIAIPTSFPPHPEDKRGIKHKIVEFLKMQFLKGHPTSTPNTEPANGKDRILRDENRRLDVLMITYVRAQVAVLAFIFGGYIPNHLCDFKCVAIFFVMVEGVAFLIAFLHASYYVEEFLREEVAIDGTKKSSYKRKVAMHAAFAWVILIATVVLTIMTARMKCAA